jgi:SAM-dependent methyltransferase
MNPSLERPGFALDDESTRAYFDQRAEVPAAGYMAADWGSRASQEARFSVLCEIGDLCGAAVLDVGCGAGDLWTWLQRRGLGCRYSGIDLSARMLARAQVAAPQAQLRQGSVLDLEADPRESHDWVIASGLFYRRAHAPELYFQRAVGALWRVARRGVALNTLSSWGGAAAPDEWRADPARALELVRGLGARVVLRHDYHPGDFTLYLRKPGDLSGEGRA